MRRHLVTPHMTDNRTTILRFLKPYTQTLVNTQTFIFFVRKNFIDKIYLHKMPDSHKIKVTYGRMMQVMETCAICKKKYKEVELERHLLHSHRIDPYTAEDMRTEIDLVCQCEKCDTEF